MPPIRNNSIKSWNCPWTSPHTVTGHFTSWTLDSLDRISFAWKKDEFKYADWLISNKFGIKWMAVFVRTERFEDTSRRFVRNNFVKREFMSFGVKCNVSYFGRIQKPVKPWRVRLLSYICFNLQIKYSFEGTDKYVWEKL